MISLPYDGKLLSETTAYIAIGAGDVLIVAGVGSDGVVAVLFRRAVKGDIVGNFFLVRILPIAVADGPKQHD